MMFENDLAFLRESLPDLRDYLFSKEVYWRLKTVSGGLNLPQLTIGNLALSQARLESSPLSLEQEQEFKDISERIQQVRSEWLANWRIKAGHEFQARLNLWQQYLRELRGDPRQHAPFYSNEVRHRTIFSLLLSKDHINNPAEVKDQLTMFDQILRGLTRPGPFVWESRIADSFPKELYWFLYVTIGEKSTDR